MNRSLPHMAQLDGLRAFAVLAVLVHHYGDYYFQHAWAYGAAAGVKLFFVLSGFLITGILLRASDSAKDGMQTPLHALKLFYMRRFLRIFPLYYAVVLACYVLNVDPTRKIIGWLLSYTLNIHMARQGWFEATFAHFWSLCVEEQFYIFWPWVVLFLPKRFRLWACLTMLLTAPAWRVAYILSKYTITSGIGTYITTWMCLDSLGTGALLAVLFHQKRLAPASFRILNRLVLPAALSAVVLVELLPFGGLWQIEFLVHNTAQSIVFGWLIARAAYGFKGTIGAVLTWAPLLYIGKISYGIYVYHPLVPQMLKWFLAGASLEWLNAGWIGAATAAVTALSLSSLSWFVLESPLNNLKRHFEVR